jgi:hypothetical protein
VNLRRSLFGACPFCRGAFKDTKVLREVELNRLACPGIQVNGVGPIGAELHVALVGIVAANHRYVERPQHVRHELTDVSVKLVEALLLSAPPNRHALSYSAAAAKGPS